VIRGKARLHARAIRQAEKKLPALFKKPFMATFGERAISATAILSLFYV